MAKPIRFALSSLAILLPAWLSVAAPPLRASERPTRGVELPAGAMTGDADATAVELNPGQLGFVGASSFVLATSLQPDDAVRPGRGAGAFFAAPLLFGLHAGGSVQWLRPPHGAPDHWKTQLGLAGGLSRTLAWGFAWSHYFADRGSLLHGGDAYDVGLSYRPDRRVALAAALHDLNAGGSLQPALGGEVALRPFGTDRLELGIGARWGARRGDLGTRGRAGVRLFDGVRLFAGLEAVPFDTATGVANDYRGTLGFWLDFDRAGFALAGLGGSNGGFGPDDSRRLSSGALALVRLSGDRYPAVYDSRHVEKVYVAAKDDRAFVSLVVHLRRLADDRSVAGVLLHMSEDDFAWGRLEEIRALIGRLQKAGKTVYAYLPSAGMRDYYLASACDRIYLHPAGGLEIAGLSRTTTFYKGLMERIGVNLDLVRIAEWKGAMEPFIGSEHTEAVRQNLDAVIDDGFSRVRAAFGHRPGKAAVDETRIRALLDKGSFTPEEAKAAGLVDEIAHEAALETIDGRGVTRGDGAPEHPTAWAVPRVAIVLVEGVIAGGKSRDTPFDLEQTSGSETIVAALDAARQDGAVHAVVLRVQSRGGSAFASDEMARAVARLRDAGKPVVVSMGDVAASGGYYVAAPGNVIFANASTLTGSIGIFTYKIDVRGLMDLLGVTSETSKRGQHADGFSLYRPWTEEERKLAHDRIQGLYDLFLKTVAEGRTKRGTALSAERVNEIGRGHLWTGAQAQGLGLIDEIGGLDAAIDRAAKLGHVPTARGGLPELVLLPRVRTGPLEMLLGNLGASAPTADTSGLLLRLAAQLGRPALRLLVPLAVEGPTGTLAAMPYDVEIR